MPSTRRARKIAAVVFALLLLVLVGAWIVSSRSYDRRRDQAVSECRSKLAEAHTRGDTLVALNWIPSAQQMATRLTHCRDVLLATRTLP